MKKLLCALFVLLCAFYAHGQAWQWARSTHNNEGIDGWLVKTDINNNVFAATIFDGHVITFGPDSFYNPVNGSYKTAIVKYDSAGNILWSDANVLGETLPLDLTTDNDGNAYLFGYTWSDTVKFQGHLLINDYVDSAIHPHLVGWGCYYIIKYSPTGSIIWAVMGDNITPSYGSGAGIVTDKMNNVYITGTYANATIKIGSYTLLNSVSAQYGSYEMFLAKYDPSGNVVWAKSYGGPRRDFGIAIAMDDHDELYVAGGYSSQTIIFDTVHLQYSSADTDEAYTDVFLTKFDTAGSVIWARTSAGSAYVENMTIDKNDNIYLSGFINDTAALSFGIHTLDMTDTAFRFSDFIAKFDTLGNADRLQEIYTLGINGASTRVHGLTSDACGNIWLSGKIQKDTFGVRLDSNTVVVAPIGSNDPAFFAGFDENGNVIYAQAFTTGGDDYSSLSADALGNVYFCDDVQFLTLVFGNDSVKPFGGEQMFVAKFRSGVCGPVVADHVSLEGNVLTLFPNPATSTLTIQYTGVAKGTTASIYDMMGRLMGSYPLTGTTATISIQYLPPGLYQCRISDGAGNVITKKLVIMR